MKPVLIFQTETYKMGELGPQTSTPDLLAGSNIQNKTNFYLEEEDEIYEGYGKLDTSYPYRQYTCYTRKLSEKKMKTAVLENDFLKAVFLPEMGGRLWSLTDKKTGKNLLYTNDVIRPSNLAIRNAWVSGGVEWNISMIGHTPFTMEPLFTASLENEEGNPVLRMYEYERVRKVTYQMDFWLGEKDEFLNCRMRILNQTDQVVPMYWWSNMAVPEYENGRVVVPAKTAFTNREDGVYKVEIPMVNGIDISRCKNIPNQVDYFFDIPAEAPKYIANLDEKGYGLLHLSTSRLRSRKLFSWGKNKASDNWQKFLTEDGGRYLEIQAGLGKTQYGCIPMAPHTAWEWMELYGPVQASSRVLTEEFEQAEKEIRFIAEQQLKAMDPGKRLRETKEMSQKQAKLLYYGSTYGAFENALRQYQGEQPLSPNLDFGQVSEEYQNWCSFLKTGRFPEPDPTKAPGDFVADSFMHGKLAETIETVNRRNWYANYQLGLSFFQKKHWKNSRKYLLRSNECRKNPWALHGLAVLSLKDGDQKTAACLITEGYALVPEDLTYLKEAWKILLKCEAYEKIRELYCELPSSYAKESRIYFGYLTALARTGCEKQVLSVMDREYLVLDDLRECEDSLGDLWCEVYQRIYGEKGELPDKYCFHSL